jgi:hypothetical protein
MRIAQTPINKLSAGDADKLARSQQRKPTGIVVAPIARVHLPQRGRKVGNLNAFPMPLPCTYIALLFYLYLEGPL